MGLSLMCTTGPGCVLVDLFEWQRWRGGRKYHQSEHQSAGVVTTWSFTEYNNNIFDRCWQKDCVAFRSEEKEMQIGIREMAWHM